MQSYNEIIDLAEEGNNFNVDMSNMAFTKENKKLGEGEEQGEEEGTGKS